MATFTKSDLRHEVTERGSNFFSSKNMKFAGDTMANYGLRSTVIRTNYDADGEYVGAGGVEVECWELFRKKAVKHGVKKSAYFAKDTFKRLFPANEV